MGLLTRFLRRTLLRLVSVVFCTPELLPIKSESERRFGTSAKSLRMSSLRKKDSTKTANDPDQENQSVNEQEDEQEFDDGRALTFSEGLKWSSVLFDVMDLAKMVLDIMFAVRLARLPDATVYAAIVGVGVVIGRVVLFRSTYLLFHGGIEIGGGLKDILQARSASNKMVYVMQLLHCLAYAEFAAFLFETYPTLLTCAFWRTINFPPAPLELLERVNVIVSVILGVTIAVTLLSLTLFVAAWQGYLRLKFASDTLWRKVYNGSVLVLLGLFVAAVATALWQVVELAWRVTILDARILPSGSLLWGLIKICDDVESLQDRTSFCDEKAFLIKTGLAWVLAGYLSFFLFFKPAQIADESNDPPPLPAVQDDISADNDSLSDLPPQKHTMNTSKQDVTESSVTDNLEEDGDMETGNDSREEQTTLKRSQLKPITKDAPTA